MIKRLPGWANYLVLWAAYFVIGIALDWICRFHTDWRFIGFFTAFFAGAYLAKWRFMDGKWRFW